MSKIKLPKAGLNANGRNVQQHGKLLAKDLKRNGKPVNPASGNMFLLGQYSTDKARKGKGAEANAASAYMCKLQQAAGRKPIAAFSGNNSLPTFLNNSYANAQGWNFYIEHCQHNGNPSFRFWAWPYNVAVPSSIASKIGAKKKAGRKPKASKPKGEVVQIKPVAA